MLKLGSAIIIIVIVCFSSLQSRAFDNIEADAVYDGPIKSEIQAEFVQGLTMLQAQASALKMQVREQDLQALQNHMYDKASLKAACFDQAISIKKTINPKTDVKKFADGCISTHLRFAEWLNAPAHLDEKTPGVSTDPPPGVLKSIADHKITMCVLEAQVPKQMYNPAYEFLKVGTYYYPKNYLALKKCYGSIGYISR